MIVELLPWFLMALLGLMAGIASGLLGIGGGMLVVPGLFYIFTLMQFPENILMHLAVGTSMGVMICTATSSILAHQSTGDVQWKIFWRMIPGILMGVAFGTVLDQVLTTHWLKFIFGLFLLLISLKILWNFKPRSTLTQFPNSLIMTSVGLGIGFKSGLLGIGGGAISVPFLMYCGLPMYEVVGTSASFTLPIAIFGTILFLISSQGHSLIAGSIGYIYWPALVLVAPCTMVGALIGTKLSHIIPGKNLQILFGIFLFLLSVHLLLR